MTVLWEVGCICLWAAGVVCWVNEPLCKSGIEIGREFRFQDDDDDCRLIFLVAPDAVCCFCGPGVVCCLASCFARVIFLLVVASTYAGDLPTTSVFVTRVYHAASSRKITPIVPLFFSRLAPGRRRVWRGEPADALRGVSRRGHSGADHGAGRCEEVGQREEAPVSWYRLGWAVVRGYRSRCLIAHER